MRVTLMVAAALTAGLALATLGPVAVSSTVAAPETGPVHRSTEVCTRAPAGFASCLSEMRTDINRTPFATTTAASLTPADIRSAYGLTSSSSGGRTVAIVAAYDAPTVEADLGVYRKTFGLPICSTGNGCFRKVNQSGGAVLPAANGAWAQEMSLDVEMVAATCPDCKILLVEATSATFSDLSAAVNYAATRGPAAISNSYGGSDLAASSAYDHPGIAITAASGDSAYGVQAPASFGTVIAVGGTSLRRAANARGWTETAWKGAGSGCSTQNAQPPWQSTAVTKCATRATSDVSAVADPQTSVAVYDSTPVGGMKGWLAAGGTSVAAPIIASVYALSRNTAGYPAAYTWAHRSALNDVVSGSNGVCALAVWCQAAVGWDGPTGLGTPRGTAAF